jgi:hypothetical protein
LILFFLKFLSLINHKVKRSTSEHLELRLDTWLLNDIRILEGIFPLLIRDNFTFILTLDISLARDVIMSQIRYWCLSVTV